MKLFKLIVLFSILLSSNLIEAQDSTSFYYKLGVYQLKKNNCNDAIISFSKLLQIDAKNTEYLYSRATAYLKCGLQDKAFIDFILINSLKSEKANIELSKIYAEKGDLKKSIEHLKKYLQSPNKLPESEIKLDKSFSQLSKTQEWTNLWKNDWYSDVEIKIAEIRYLLKSELLQDALDQSTDFVNTNTTLEKAYDLRADVYLANKELKYAINDLTILIKMAPKNEAYYLKRSELYLQNNQYSKALLDLSKVQELTTENIDVYYQKALIYLKTNKPDLALAELFYFEKYIATPEVLELIANGLSLSKEYGRSAVYYSKLIENNLRRVDYFLKRGGVYFELKDYTKAEIDFTQALDLDPRFSEAYYQRGLTRYFSGNLNGACEDWKKASNLKHPDVFEYLKLCK